jgi:hypothetical protein
LEHYVFKNFCSRDVLRHGLFCNWDLLSLRCIVVGML